MSDKTASFCSTDVRTAHTSTTDFDKASHIRDKPRTFSANNALTSDCQPAQSKAHASVLRCDWLRDNKLLQTRLEGAERRTRQLVEKNVELRLRVDKAETQVPQLLAIVERQEKRQDELLQKNTLLELQLKALQATQKCDDCAFMQHVMDV